MRSANLFFFTQPQETFEDWYQVQQNTPFEEKAEPFFVEIQQIPINYGTITDTAYQDSLYWKEQHLYGSSRLGIAKPELEVTNYTPSNASTLTTNFRNYELTNHLGNILATIKDEKQQVSLNGTTVDYYEPIVITANDYYPFGMVMPNRSFSLAGSGYRFGFNGKENDKETGTQDYGFRIYNPQIGKFLSVDPLFKSYPWYTPYQFAGNKPIKFIDLDGAEEYDPDYGWIFDHTKTSKQNVQNIKNISEAQNKGVHNLNKYVGMNQKSVMEATLGYDLDNLTFVKEEKSYVRVLDNTNKEAIGSIAVNSNAFKKYTNGTIIKKQDIINQVLSDGQLGSTTGVKGGSNTPYLGTDNIVAISNFLNKNAFSQDGLPLALIPSNKATPLTKTIATNIGNWAGYQNKVSEISSKQGLSQEQLDGIGKAGRGFDSDSDSLDQNNNQKAIENNEIPSFRHED